MKGKRKGTWLKHSHRYNSEALLSFYFHTMKRKVAWLIRQVSCVSTTELLTTITLSAFRFSLHCWPVCRNELEMSHTIHEYNLWMKKLRKNPNQAFLLIYSPSYVCWSVIWSGISNVVCSPVLLLLLLNSFITAWLIFPTICTLTEFPLGLLAPPFCPVYVKHSQ